MKLEDLVLGSAPTRLVYREDSYLEKLDSVVKRTALESGGSIYVVLDRTVFHPKSGGQPSDRGFLKSEASRIEVKKCMMVSGVVVHYGRVEGSPPRDGDEVEGEIDWEMRYLYMRRHTAAHLIDHCLSARLGRRLPTKDSWLGDPCYVAYYGDPPTRDVLDSVTEEANGMISEGRKINVETTEWSEVLRKYPGLDAIYRLGSIENVRLMIIDGSLPIPCGGTHLHDIREIRGVSVRSVESLGDTFRIHFEVAG